MEYPQLQGHSDFRILVILPGSKFQRIDTALVVASLADEDVSFSALSYVWGSPGRKKKIMCNGSELLVTKNLHCALRRIREMERGSAIWIDQICINQDNIPERNRQVSLMGEIFRKATYVFVWLGEAADHSSNALHLIYQLVKHEDDRAKETGQAVRPMIEHRSISPIWQHPRGWGTRWVHFAWLLGPERTWSAVRPFYLRPWFSRIWVVQEVALSNDVVVVCGDLYLPWEYIAKFVAYVPPISPSRFYGMDPQRKGLSTYQPQAIMKTAELRKNAVTQRLLDLVIEHRRCESTDPRDKIFALLGLGSYDVQADYLKPVKEIYKDFATQNILRVAVNATLEDLLEVEESHDLFRILYSAGALNQQLQLPSWVPDWSVDFKATPLWPVNQWKLEDQEFAASGRPRTRHGTVKVHEGGCLELSAKVWDVIRFAGRVHLDLSSLKSQRRRKSAIVAWIKEAITIAKCCEAEHPSGMTCEDAFRKTVLLKREPLGAGALSWNFGLRDRKLIRNLYRQRGFDEWLWWEWDKDSYVDVVANANGRTFFITEGGFMGLGLYGVRAGDKICVLLGGDVPVALRAREEQFILLGECYVDGAMDGEVMEDSSCPLTTITLV